MSGGRCRRVYRAVVGYLERVEGRGIPSASSMGVKIVAIMQALISIQL